MKIVRNVKEMSSLVRAIKKGGRSIGFVPTMGYLHEGHLSLVNAARRDADVVVMSVFVNPAQFGPEEDFGRYPRDFKRDRRMSREAGVDILFCPSAGQMYPPGYATYVNVERITYGLCGVSRPGHFRGVATVVAKLFGIVKPDIAYFGQKDAQQAAVIRRMVRDLNIDVEIRTMPIVREKDGLAMSSRNRYLSGHERTRALAIYRALKKAGAMVAAGEKDARRIVREMKRVISPDRSFMIEYISIVDPDELTYLRRISGKALIALAARVGKTRLIDNIIVRG